MGKVWFDFECQLWALQLSLLLEDIHDELDSLYGRENFLMGNEYTLLYLFHVEHIIHQAQQ